MAAGLVAVVIALFAASRGDQPLHLLAAMSFAIAAVALGLQANRPFWRLPRQRVRNESLAVSGRRSALLLAAVYGWGAAVLLTVYPLARLSWYHWWQYGTLMALVAGALLLLGQRLVQPASPLLAPRAQLLLLRLTIVQAMAALGGVGWLVLSGKLATIKGDWAANHIFVAGGLAIAALSGLAAFTQHRLRQTD